MLPWNYGFEWNAGHMIFLGAFYTVLAVVAATVANATLRSRRVLQARHAGDIRWKSDFHDLPPRDRVCRHVLTGEFRSRECPNAFDCRQCETHAKLLEHHPQAPSSPTRKRGREQSVELLGMTFPLDRFYHRFHTWAHLEPDGSVTIGLDDFGRRVLNGGTLDLPQPGAHIRANATEFIGHTADAEVRIPSPINGEVIETGGPDRDWLLRVHPDSLDFTHLLRGAEIRPWLLWESIDANGKSTVDA